MTDPVEQHGSWTEAEASSEDLAVVSEDLLGRSMGLERKTQCRTDLARRCLGDDPRTDAEPRVVVDARHDLDLGAVLQEEPTDDVHLPQLHGPRALPALVVRALLLSTLRLDQPVTHQGPIDRRATRQRVSALSQQMGPDRSRTPPRMGEAKVHDPRFDRSRRLVRA